jgi:hypothetical protein
MLKYSYAVNNELTKYDFGGIHLMQNNKRDDLKAQTSNLHSLHNNKTSANIPRVSAQRVYPTRVSPQRIYPDPNVRPNFHSIKVPNQPQHNSNQNSTEKITHIYPIKLPPIKKTPPQKKKKYSKLFDFLLGLVIGFVVFGTAAVFVIRAIIEIFV